tara:strand:- start:100 stop:762 length:663 start_codon:yes stop_codon:yes gene_type:complete
MVKIKININKFDTIIPIGYNCGSGMVLNNLKLRKCAYPLDWVVSNPEYVYTYFLTDFKDYYLTNENDTTNYIGQYFNYFLTSDNHNTHKTSADDEIIENTKSIFENNKIKFKRRIERLLNHLKTNNKTLFFHMKEYKINKNNDIDLLENEKIYDEYLLKLSNFIEEVYSPLKHVLLVIDFGTTEEIIVQDRIITITLKNIVLDYKRFNISDQLKKFLKYE